MEQQNENTLEKVNTWMRNSIMLKLGTITLLILLLLIPTSMIKSIIYEREALSESARLEVSNKWANAQSVVGPIIVVPVRYTFEQMIDEKPVVKTYTKQLKVLPKSLNINGKIDPKSLKRGIYEVVVYESKLDVSGTFDLSQIEVIDQDFKEIQWDKARIVMGLTDLRGIRNNLTIGFGDEKLSVNPGTGLPDLVPTGVSAPVDLNEQLEHPIPFQLSLDIQGSENLSFVPLGSTTLVKLNSNWTAPSFIGNFIPKKRDITESGFTAEWQVLELNRNYPQYWLDDAYSGKVERSAFGTDLILPMDDYQKSMRSSKYAIMTIGLTFLIFFISEIINKKKIHPFQYALVGLSLSVFYVLLVSLSEHISFNLSYLISMVAIVGMITLYALSVFQRKSQAMLVSGVMTALYGFMFVTLQLADYALLLGSVGLVIILGLTMYFTRNINWYGLKFTTT
jgi:inner membrane protein